MKRFIALFFIFIFSLNTSFATEDVVTWGSKASNVVYSADLLTITGTTSGFGSARSSHARYEGMRCAEIEITATAGSSRYGIGDSSFPLSGYLGQSGGTVIGIWSLVEDIASGGFLKSGTDSSLTQAVGTRYMLQLDFTNKKGYIQRNGVYRTSGANPASGAGYDFTWTTSNPLYIAASSYNPGDGMKLNASAASMGARLPSGCTAWAEQNGSSSPPPISGNAGIGLLGDSITWYLDQGGSSSFTIFGFSPTFNYGVPSDTTTGMLSRVDALIALKPKQIYLLGGVNDYSLPEATTVSNILAIIDKCNAADIPIIVQGILPVSASYSGPTNNTAITSRKNAIHAAILNYKGGQWLDWGATLNSSDYQSDGIHLNASGFIKWNAALSSYINLNR